MPHISVIICTHNPRLDYLDRVLAALRGQTLSFDQWELLLIDNASSTPLATVRDLSWHPNARVIVEEKLGLTAARLRGIKDSVADLIVFVDDDNVLGADYLEHALNIANEYSCLGAFGGSIIGEFEAPPEPWLTRYLGKLAIREIQRDSWSNLAGGWTDSTPFGAGLCIRRRVAEDYCDKTVNDVRRQALGRVGTGMGSADDYDLAYCAIDLGMGTGTFARLKVTHLIPKRRMTVDYIARATAGVCASDVVFGSLRPAKGSGSGSRPRRNYLAGLQFLIQFAQGSKIDRKIAIAARSGRRTGKRLLRQTSGDLSAIQY